MSKPVHRVGIFRSSVLVNFVNSVGIPLLALYLCAMFMLPWLEGKWNWEHVQAVWDRWQTLNAGALAFLASLIAFNISKFNENVQREREFVAAKSFLPSTLSELMNYFSQSARLLEVFWAADGRPSAAQLTRPDLSMGYREVFSSCIRHADPQVGSYLSNIIVQLQIQDARLRNASLQGVEARGWIIDRHSVVSYLYQLGELYVLVDKLFGFARSEEPFAPKNWNWEDFRNAYSNLGVRWDQIFIDENMNLQAYTQLRLARTTSNKDDA